MKSILVLFLAVPLFAAEKPVPAPAQSVIPLYGKASAKYNRTTGKVEIEKDADTTSLIETLAGDLESAKSYINECMVQLKQCKSQNMEAKK